MNAFDPVTLLEHQRDALLTLGVRRIGLFGSVLQPEAFSETSDVDVYVEFDPGRKTFESFNRLYELLESLFQRRIDLVTEASLSPHIGPKILQSVHYAVLSP